MFEITFGRSQKKKPRVRPRCKWEVIIVFIVVISFSSLEDEV